MASEEQKLKLPQRSTRGKRMRAQLADEEAEADAEFWNQEFFAEDARDADYVSEKEEEDVPDSDFFESESEDDDEEVEVKERKKKTLKPPGAPPGGRPRAAKPPTAPKPPKPPASTSPSAAGAAAVDELPQSVIFEATYEAPSLRKSTRTRVEEAQKERQQREQQAKATRRPQRQAEVRVLTQEELLAEAARTELGNLASLKKLLAQEEETKKKANMKKQRFGGPLIRFRSRTVQVLVPPDVAAREQQWKQQQQQQQPSQAAATTASASAGQPDPADAAAGQQAPTAAAGGGAAASSQALGANQPVQIDATPPQQQQQQQQPVPTGPVLQCVGLNTLQCLGMKAPKWLLPQRAPGAAAKPICPITGGPACYRDPLTGHYYSSAEAFRELRRRLGQPLPPQQPYRRLAASPAAELQALLDAAGRDAAAGGVGVQPASSAAAAAAGRGAGLSGLPAGEQQLLELVQQHILQQQSAMGGKGRGRSQAFFSQQQQQQQPVPDEVAALVVQVSQMVHG